MPSFYKYGKTFSGKKISFPQRHLHLFSQFFHLFSILQHFAFHRHLKFSFQPVVPRAKLFLLHDSISAAIKISLRKWKGEFHNSSSSHGRQLSFFLREKKKTILCFCLGRESDQLNLTLISTACPANYLIHTVPVRCLGSRIRAYRWFCFPGKKRLTLFICCNYLSCSSIQCPHDFFISNTVYRFLKPSDSIYPVDGFHSIFPPACAFKLKGNCLQTLGFPRRNKPFAVTKQIATGSWNLLVIPWKAVRS